MAEQGKKDLEAWEAAKEQRRLDEKFAVIKGQRGWSQEKFTNRPKWDAPEFVAASFARDLRSQRVKCSNVGPKLFIFPRPVIQA